MGLREARPAIIELKKRIQARYPETEIKKGPGFDGGPKDVYLYAYAAEDAMDGIIEMSSPRILDILLKTGIFVHVIPIRPGTMQWLWGAPKKSKPRRAPRAPANRAASRAIAEPRAKYRASAKKVKAAR